MDLAARYNIMIVLLTVLNDATKTFVVDLVGNGPAEIRDRRVVVAGKLLDLLDKQSQEAVVDGLVHVDALGCDADLAGVGQCASRDQGHDALEVDVLADDGGVVAGELEDDALEGARAVLHDAAADGDGAREADVVDALVQGDALAELGAAVDGLEDARRQHRLRQLAELEQRVRRERRRLDDHAVPRRQRRHHLDRAQDHGEVPRRDGAQHADRRVRCDHSRLLVLELYLVFQRYGYYGRGVDYFSVWIYTMWARGQKRKEEGKRTVILKVRDCPLDLIFRHHLRFPRLLHEDLAEELLVVLDAFCHLGDLGLALSHRGLLPRLEGASRGLDGIVEVLGRGEGGIPKGLLGARVDDLVVLLGEPNLSVDDVEELQIGGHPSRE